MRKAKLVIVTLILAGLFIMVTGCSNGTKRNAIQINNNQTNKQADSIIGLWKYSVPSYSYEGEEVDEDEPIYYYFSESGKLVYIDGTPINGLGYVKYKQSGNKIILPDLDESYSFELNGNILRMDDENFIKCSDFTVNESEAIDITETIKQAKYQKDVAAVEEIRSSFRIAAFNEKFYQLNGSVVYEDTSINIEKPANIIINEGNYDLVQEYLKEVCSNISPVYEIRSPKMKNAKVTIIFEKGEISARIELASGEVVSLG